MEEATLLDWGRRVRERREAMDLTQEDLGEAAGSDQSVISRLERGRLKQPSDDLKWRVAGALRLPVDRLFPYPNVMPPMPAEAAASS